MLANTVRQALSHVVRVRSPIEQLDAVVEELTRDLVGLKISEDIRDVAEKPCELFETARQIKLHLNSNAFFDSEFGLDYPHNILAFNVRQ